MTWLKNILTEKGKPYLLAIMILADLVYWYRPSEIRDEGTGEVVGSIFSLNFFEYSFN